MQLLWLVSYHNDQLTLLQSHYCVRGRSQATAPLDEPGFFHRSHEAYDPHVPFDLETGAYLITVEDTMSLSSFPKLREIIIADIKRTGSEETDIMDMMGKAALYVLFAFLEWPAGWV